MTWTIFAWILILNTFAAMIIAGALYVRNIRKPGSQMMRWMLVSFAIWSFGYAMLMLSPSLAGKHFWLKVENIGIVSAPVFWFLFAAEYTKLDRWLVKRKILFFIIPVITLGLLFSETGFHLYYLSTTPYAEGIGPLIVTGQLWYWVQLIQSYLLLAVGVVFLLWHIFTFRENYQKRVFTVLAAIAVPVVLNTFYHTGAQLFPSLYIHVDLTPISFTLTAGLINTAVFGQQLFEMSPIARHTVLENIVEMVIVVDREDQILDMNRTTLEWLEKSSEEIIGQDIFDIFPAPPQLADHYRTADAENHTFTFNDAKERIVDITISPIYNRRGELEGRVVVAYDVTERRIVEENLQNANEELKIKLEEIESLQAQLKEQTIRDPLTGLFNRRYLAEILDAEIARSERDNLHLSAIIMDVDHFKVFNDSYGHKCGDYVLQYLSNLLLDNTRRGDTVCRYGGEEFVILMPKVGIDVAFDRAEAWREALASSTIRYDEQDLSIKISAGVACFPVSVESSEELIKAADKALYHSKENGRNKVTVYPFYVAEEEIL